MIKPLMVANWHSVLHHHPALEVMLPESHLTCKKDEGDNYARHGTCTRERTGSVLHGPGFSRHQAFDGNAKRKSGSIGLSQLSRLWHVCGILLP
jgi:hypothetical protein